MNQLDVATSGVGGEKHYQASRYHHDHPLIAGQTPAAGSKREQAFVARLTMRGDAHGLGGYCSPPQKTRL